MVFLDPTPSRQDRLGQSSIDGSATSIGTWLAIRRDLGETYPSDFWVFDEIHKFRGWRRNYLQVLYDSGPSQRIMVWAPPRLVPVRRRLASRPLPLPSVASAHLQELGAKQADLRTLLTGRFPRAFLGRFGHASLVGGQRSTASG